MADKTLEDTIEMLFRGLLIDPRSAAPSLGRRLSSWTSPHHTKSPSTYPELRSPNCQQNLSIPIFVY